MIDNAPTDPEKVHPAVRHVPKLAEIFEDREPLYACHLCRRRGTLAELRGEECRGRTGTYPAVGSGAA